MLKYLRAGGAVFALSLAALNASFAAVQSKPITYSDGDTMLTGQLFWDDAVTGKRPGILVVHEWWGLNDYVKRRAAQLAEMGYAAFALDMYGTDKVTEHPAQAQEWSSAIAANIGAWRQRAAKGREQLKASDLVNADRIAVIGYCFGGATAMQLAYSGADVKGVVSFHGALPAAQGDDAKMIKGKVLIEHGNDDAFVPPEQVEAFQSALTEAGVDFTFHGHDGARHGFTNPDAGSFGIDNLRYDPAADESSWRSMQEFFDDIL